MVRLVFFVTILTVAATSSEAEASFFNWIIHTSDSSAQINGQNKIVRLPDYKFPTDYEIENKDWSCKVRKPDGFNSEILGATQYQEGVSILCTLKSNKSVSVSDYGACTKWTTGRLANNPVENSGPSVTVMGPSGTFIISATCSAQSWKSQGFMELNH